MDYHNFYCFVTLKDFTPMIQPHHFFHLYAGLPLRTRTQIFSFHELMTFKDVYKRMVEIEKQIRDLHNEQEFYLKSVERYLIKNSTSKI